MRNTIIALLLVSLFALPSYAQDNDEGRPDPAELAEKEVEKLEKILKLEDWQMFFADSILCYNYTEWMAEIEKLQKARVENSDLYIAIQDKWTERTEEAFRKILTDEQWAAYLRNGEERVIKDREKRRAKAAAALEEKPTKEKKKRK